MKLEQQVRIMMGMYVLVGPGVYLWHQTSGLVITGLMGITLILSGTMGYCGTQVMLSYCPWNKTCGIKGPGI